MPKPPPAVSPESAKALFAIAPFRFFWAARFCDLLAVQVQAVTLAWQVYAIARLTRSVPEAALMVGMIGLAQFLPLFALTLNAGAAADRNDRRKIMLACVTVEVVVCAGLAAYAYSREAGLWPIFAMAAVFGAARAFFSPSSTAMAPMLVPRALLPRAIAWNSLNWQSAAILGPAVGGLLCAHSPALAYAVATVLYLASFGLLLLMRGANTRPERPEGSRVALVKEGLAYIWREKIVFGAISLDLFAVLLGGATALLPVFAKDVLHVGAEGFGILRAAPAVGATVIAIVLAVRPIRRRAGPLMFAGVAVFGLATLVFALSKSMILSFAALVVLGGADMISVYVRQTLIQLVTPDPMRGRVAAVSYLFIGASNELGEFETGVVARFLGPVGAAVFGGVGCLIVTGVWARLFPSLRRADRLE